MPSRGGGWLQRPAMSMKLALDEERDLRRCLQQALEERSQSHENHKVERLSEHLDFVLEEQDELSEDLRQAYEALQQERADRLLAQERFVEAELLYRAEHTRYRDVFEKYEDTLCQLLKASQFIGDLQDALSHSEWTSEYLRAHVHEVLNNVKSKDDSAPEAFSMAKITQDIRDAISEACKLPATEKKKALRELKLRWHPDKNKVLKDFASEVTEIINDELEAMEKEPPIVDAIPKTLLQLPASALSPTATA